MKCIVFHGGYKYLLRARYEQRITIKPKQIIKTPYLQLTLTGVLSISEGYAWDGPSGPAIDTYNFMRPSLVHDALYQLMREGLLNAAGYRKSVDMLLLKMCREDGMSWLRAKWVYIAVRTFARRSSRPESIKPIKHAPKGCPWSYD